ncbi:hypothetical protein [uncultured Endozoicomonas sp.]|nr:hypothetical protein [uncultured Endozoicomonas sp.]
MPIDLTGKIAAGMVQLYTELRRQTDALGMEMLVVGAMARDH